MRQRLPGAGAGSSCQVLHGSPPSSVFLRLLSPFYAGVPGASAVSLHGSGFSAQLSLFSSRILHRKASCSHRTVSGLRRYPQDAYARNCLCCGCVMYTCGFYWSSEPVVWYETCRAGQCRGVPSCRASSFLSPLLARNQRVNRASASGECSSLPDTFLSRRGERNEEREAQRGSAWWPEERSSETGR